MFGPPLAGRYAIQQELGSGAYARVYLANDLKVGRMVAVKVLNPSTPFSSESVQRLEREARIAAAVNHPNVCAVSDVGRLDNGLPFVVLEYLVGETLAARLGREPRLPVAFAVELADQMLLGLLAAHRLGFVHRDVKPANMFLVDQGMGRQLLKLLDFGTAYHRGNAESGATLTRTGVVVGTAEYMSPEQLRGLRDFDERTDVYACGVVLYEMIAGQRPFPGLSLPQLCHAIAFTQAPPLRSIVPEVPAPIARAVDTALALNPNRRHDGAATFLSELRRNSVVETPATVEARTVARPDDWDLATAEGSVRSLPPSARGSDWDATTHESGPPSILGLAAGAPLDEKPGRR